MDWAREKKKIHVNYLWLRKKKYSMLQANLSNSDKLFLKTNPNEFKICMQKIHHMFTKSVL